MGDEKRGGLEKRKIINRQLYQLNKIKAFCKMILSTFKEIVFYIFITEFLDFAIF